MTISIIIYALLLYKSIEIKISFNIKVILKLNIKVK